MDDASKVDAALAVLKQYPFVVSWKIELGHDYSGGPAVWINVVVKDEWPESSSAQADFQRLYDSVFAAMRQGNIESWPHIQFQGASEKEDEP